MFKLFILEEFWEKIVQTVSVCPHICALLLIKVQIYSDFPRFYLVSFFWALYFFGH